MAGALGCKHRRGYSANAGNAGSPVEQQMIRLELCGLQCISLLEAGNAVGAADTRMSSGRSSEGGDHEAASPFISHLSVISDLSVMKCSFWVAAVAAMLTYRNFPSKTRWKYGASDSASRAV
eukprot:6304229-Amphidinium_carterae.1